MSSDAHVALTVSTKLEVDTTIRCLVIALLLMIRYVTLWPWPLTFWLWSVVIHGGSRDQPLHQVWRSYGHPFLSYEFWHLPYDTIDRRGQVTWRQDFRGRGGPPANILIPLERQLNALQLCCWQFYIMKLCSRLFVLHCRSRPKYFHI